MNTETQSRSRSRLKFFLLVFALSIPFYWAGALTPLQLLPGLPVSALAFVCPGIAALILVYRENKSAGVAKLLKRSFDYQRITAKIWYAPIVLLRPGIMVLSFVLMRWMGAPIPTPRFAILPALGLLLAFFAAALCEELGWSGYAIDPMQHRWGALRAGVLLGLVWAGWHILPLIQVDRPPAWIAWWCLDTVAARVLIVWLYNHTGKSVFAATLYHAVSNLAWQLFPINGSYFDPRITGLITALVAAIVVLPWGRRPRPRPTP
ncbi:MAG: CPBP family glutamic-type intramembrane protease [Bryobacteraceae bacterium]